MTEKPKIPPHLIAGHDQSEAEGLEWWATLDSAQCLALLESGKRLVGTWPDRGGTPTFDSPDMGLWVTAQIGKLACYAMSRFCILEQQAREQEADDEPDTTPK